MSNSENTPEKKPRRKWLTCLIVLAIILGTPLLLVFGWIRIINSLPVPPLKISPETTYVTGPLAPNGQVDYFKAFEERIYPPELTTDDNGFRIFTRLFGDQGETKNDKDSEFYRLQKYKKLGLDPTIPPTMTLPPEPSIVFQNFYKTEGEEEKTFDWGGKTSWTAEELEEILKENDARKKKPDWNDTDMGKCRPWTLEQYPMLADWIAEIDTPLDAVADTIRKPVFFFPMIQTPESEQSGKPIFLLEMPKPDIGLCRSLARRFQTRATYRIGQGNIDGAIEDKLTLYRLGRHLTHNKGTLVQYLCGIAIEGLANAIPVNANPDCPMTKEQIQRLLEGLDALPPHAPIADAMESERFFGLSGLQKVIADMEPENGVGDLFNVGRLQWLIHRKRYDWNVLYRRMNEMYDALQEPPPRTRYRELISAIEDKYAGGLSAWQLFTMALTPRSIENAIADMLISLLFPAIEKFSEAVHRSECQENMQRLTLAMLLYEIEHGALPDANWTEQIMPYLGEDAERYFSCPSHPSPEGSTTYAMVQYGDTVPGSSETILLIELSEPVLLGESAISVEEVLERKRTGSQHPGGMNVGYRDGSVRFLTEDIADKELPHLLGRE